MWERGRRGMGVDRGGQGIEKGEWRVGRNRVGQSVDKGTQWVVRGLGTVQDLGEGVE
jgi:hypothetical protein